MKSLPQRLATFFGGPGGRGVVSAYLFGSHAEEREHRESDVDVALLLDRSAYPAARERFELRVRIGSALIASLGTNAVDVVILNDVPPVFGRKVVARGMRVHCADGEADHAFRRDVQLLAADLDIFLRRMSRLKLEALRS